ncbi:ATP-binding cassette domain-containing protein, partial [Candidatus Micrarchaeota archaeon]|nr:ATP-binding cassette domain-containing protein [Candidatus Micrarchaeota archaeon]
MTDIIRTEELTKIYTLGGEEIRAVDGIDLAINKGEFISILGPSGSGKSTLLHMIGLLDKPTNGSVFIEGKNATEMKNGETVELRRKKIGFVFQQFNLIKNLNVYENVAIPLAL